MFDSFPITNGSLFRSIILNCKLFMEKNNYAPQPIDTKDVVLPEKTE